MHKFNYIASSWQISRSGLLDDSRDRIACGDMRVMQPTLPDAATRTAMLSSGMEHGMEAGYVRLEGML